MRILQLSCLIALACGLIGCGERETRVHTDPATGENVTLRTGNAISAPANMPNFAPLYPGARIESALKADGVKGERGGMVAFRTDAAVDRVAAFYRTRLDGSGLANRQEVNMNGSLILAAASEDDTNRGVQITISPAGDTPGSYVTVTYNLGDG